MHTGQKVTNIVPDFAFERWLGLSGEIVAHPSTHLPFADRHPFHRPQPDGGRENARLPLDDDLRRLPPHETGYALKRIDPMGMPGIG